MKHILKTIISSLAVLAIATTNAASTVTVIDVLDTRTVNFSLSEDIELNVGTIAGELRILQDMEVTSVERSAEDAKKVTLTFATELQSNIEYNLLTVFGAEGSMDFSTPETLEGISLQNEALIGEEQNIESITILDSSTVEVTYVQDLVEAEFEYKVLSSLEVIAIEKLSEDDSRINVSLGSDIVPSQNYILMILSLLDANNAEVEIEGGIYDFSSPDMLESPVIEEEVTEEEATEEDSAVEGEVFPEEEATEEDNSEEVVEETLPEEETPAEEEALEVELEAAPEEGEEQSLEDVALNAAETPATGAETTVLLFLTLVINGFYFLSRRKVA